MRAVHASSLLRAAVDLVARCCGNRRRWPPMKSLGRDTLLKQDLTFRPKPIRVAS